jgi:hypothetical protein
MQFFLCLVVSESINQSINQSMFMFQLQKNNFDFFPLNRALSLAAEEDSSEKKLETLMAQVQYLVAKMKEEVSGGGVIRVENTV